MPRHITQEKQINIVDFSFHYDTACHVKNIRVTMAPSPYRPLREPLDIRLISLKPDIQHKTICCDLVYVSLQNNPAYEALSYTWDLDPYPENENDKNSCSIFLAGESIHVTPNLYFALKRLRHPSEARILWVDAICINQSDIAERGQQVQIMSKIYSQARLVVVWLGEEGPTTGLAFALMHEWQTLSAALGSEAIDKSGEFWKRVEAELKSPTLAALASIFQSRWFRRVWVIQEVVMAADAMVLCGSYSISWMTLDAFLDALNTHHFAISLVTAGGTNGVNGTLTIPRIKALREGIKSGTVYRFLDILSVTRDLQATDPRDKIYSLFSLVQGKHMPTPDYSIPADDLFRDANISILRDDPNLDMLAFFDYRTLNRRPNVAT